MKGDLRNQCKAGPNPKEIENQAQGRTSDSSATFEGSGVLQISQGNCELFRVQQRIISSSFGEKQEKQKGQVVR